MADTTDELLDVYSNANESRLEGISDFDIDIDFDEDEGMSLDYGLRNSKDTKTYGREKYSDLTVHSDFRDFRRSANNVDFEDDTIDREIARLVGENQSRSQRSLHEAIVDDDTNLAVQETHKLLSRIPKTILSGKQGENYHNLLSSSINKLINQFEKEKETNRRIVEDTQRRGQDQNEVLIKQVSLLKSENAKLRQELERKEREIGAERKNIANGRKFVQEKERERSLLREKLIKYKDLYEKEKLKSERKPASAPYNDFVVPETADSNKPNKSNVFIIPSSRSSDGFKLNSQPTFRGEEEPKNEEPIRINQSDIEKIVLRVLEQTSLREPSEIGPENEFEPENNIKSKPIAEVSKHGRNEVNINERDGQISDGILADAISKEIVVKCYIYPKGDVAPNEVKDSEGLAGNEIRTQQKQVEEHSVHPGKPEEDQLNVVEIGNRYGNGNEKEKCKQCNNEVIFDKPGGDTMSLMGEYKWTI